MILVFCWLIFLPPHPISASNQKIALVIGNGAYRTAPLRNPVHDAADIGDALKRLQFQVTLVQNGGQRAMEKAIRTFGKKLTAGGIGLFYYAGHGMQVNGRNYLIPIDARIESPSDVKYEAVDAGRVLGKMEDAGNSMNIVILDACRDNPFIRGWRSDQRGLARMDAPQGSFIAYATAPGSVAADGAGRNGIYTRHLLQHIETPGLTLERVMKAVRRDVIKATGNKQIPWASTSLIGDFYFNPDQAQAVAPVRAVDVRKKSTPENLNAEEETWEIVKTSTVIDDYTIFLEQFPNSRFATAARLKMQQLKRRQNVQNLQGALTPTAVAAIGSQTKGGDRAKDNNNDVNGVIVDRNTNLEWFVGPSRDMSWDEADRWVNALAADGKGWRMPRIWELKVFFKGGVGSKLRASIFETDGTFVWSSDQSPSDRGTYSNDALSLKTNETMGFTANVSDHIRVFAVRKRVDNKRRGKEDNTGRVPVSPIADSQVVASLDRFQKYATGIVYDQATGLEWYVGPDRDTSWYEAHSWVKNLQVGGGGWRMPRREELASLHKRNIGDRNMSPLLKTTGWFVWSPVASPLENQPVGFGYYFKGQGTWQERVVNASRNCRGFAVRGPGSQVRR
jgi:uncharacterized caspase-like protein